MAPTKITVQALVDAPVEKAWTAWTDPDHVTKWNAASDDWHTPRATSDLRAGGTFSYRMESRDGKGGFDFSGTFTAVTPPGHLHFVLDDGRHVDVRFVPEGTRTRIVESFDAETANPVELQRRGWQAILDSFKRHVEAA